MIVVPLTKGMEIIMSVQVCLISRMNFDYKEKGRHKAFRTNPKNQYHVSNMENMIVVPIRKGMEIIMSVKVCHISRINFDYKENGKKKSFSCKCATSISCIPMCRT